MPDAAGTAKYHPLALRGAQGQLTAGNVQRVGQLLHIIALMCGLFTQQQGDQSAVGSGDHIGLHENTLYGGNARCLDQQARFICRRAVDHDLKGLAKAVVELLVAFIDEAVIGFIVYFFLAHRPDGKPDRSAGGQDQFGQVVHIVGQIEIVDQVNFIAGVQHPDIPVFDGQVQNRFVIIVGGNGGEGSGGGVEVNIVILAGNTVQFVQFERGDFNGNFQVINIGIGNPQTFPVLGIQVGVYVVHL